MLRIFLLVMLLAASAITGLFGYRVYQDRSSLLGETLIYLGNHQLEIARNTLYDPVQRRGGGFNRIDTVLHWPTLKGAADTPLSAKNDAPELIFIAFEDAKSRTLNPMDIDPADRPSDIYARFLSEEAWTNPGGLIMRRFRAGTPYAGEELYLSETDERIFAARCPAANIAENGIKEEPCLWQTRLDNLDLQVRFPARLLPEWETLNSNVRSFVERLKPQARKR